MAVRTARSPVGAAPQAPGRDRAWLLVVLALGAVAAGVRLLDPQQVPWLRNLLIVFGSLLAERRFAASNFARRHFRWAARRIGSPASHSAQTVGSEAQVTTEQSAQSITSTQRAVRWSAAGMGGDSTVAPIAARKIGRAHV